MMRLQASFNFKTISQIHSADYGVMPNLVVNRGQFLIIMFKSTHPCRIR